MERNSRSDGSPGSQKPGDFLRRSGEAAGRGCIIKLKGEPEARKERLQRQRQPLLDDGLPVVRKEGDTSHTISRDIGFFAFKGQRKGFICHNIQIIPYFLESTENCIK